MKRTVVRPDRFLTMALSYPALRLFRASRQPAVPILMYHGIHESRRFQSDYYETNTPPRLFREHMRFLRDHHYRTVRLAEALEVRPGEKAVAITFDDGYRDFYTEAFPILSAANFQATLFVTSTFPDARTGSPANQDFMSWNEIREVNSEGIEIGSHTATHPKLWTLSSERVDGEVRGSKETIEHKIGTTVRAFSHPFAFPEQNRRYREFLTGLLQGCGYDVGVSTIIGRANARAARYFLPRLPINGHDDLALFRAKLEGAYDWMHVPQRLYKQWFKREQI